MPWEQRPTDLQIQASQLGEWEQCLKLETTLEPEGLKLHMRPLFRCIVRGVLGVVLLAVVAAGLVVVSLVAMYSDRHTQPA